jgi:hypothetical protein
MMKLGVLERRQFFAAPPPGLVDGLYYRLSKSRVSLHLLQLPSEPSVEDGTLFERLMPHVRISSGVYRTTYRQRFRNLDPLVNDLLATRFRTSAEMEVHDWAASACLTSCEWAESLFPLFPRVRFVASDLLLFLVEIQNRSTGEIFIAEQDGRPLQYIKPPFVIRMQPPEPWALPVNRLWYMQAERGWQKLREGWRLPERWLDPANEEPIEQNGYILRKLPLIHPEARALARIDARFSVRPHSIFEKLKEPVSVIRSMNILNRAYFSEQQLAEGARCVIDSLVAGGIWILGRTVSENPPVHEVSIFRKQDSGALEVLERVGPGSEIESIALAASCGTK